MKSVIYNPNHIDSIFVAAVLQTYGWKAYAANEIIDITEGKFYWVGLMPTLNHFPFVRKFSFFERLAKFRDKLIGKEKKSTVEHTCFVKAVRARKSEHIVLKNVSYGDTTIQHIRKDVYLRNDHTTSLLEQVCAEISGTEKINTNEVHFLNYLIDDFYRPNQTVESLAMTITNVLAALESLRNGELFTPIRFSEDRSLKPELVKAMGQLKRLKEKTRRVLSVGTNFQITKTTKGDHTRVVHTYESEDWWFIRRYLRKDDIGLNTVVSATGMLIDATVDYNTEHLNQDPIVVIS